MSHPIQYFCPQYASWTRLPGVEPRVFFASRHGLDPYFDPGFSRSVNWADLTFEFPHEFLPGAEGRPANAAIDAPGLEPALAAFDPHCIVVNGYAQRLARRALSWARKSAIPVLMFTDSQLLPKRSCARRALKALVLPPLLRRVDRFLTTGDANEAYLRRYGVANGRFVRSSYPLDVASLDRALEARAPARAAVRRAHGVPAEHAVLLMAGKLVPWKRQCDLIAAANRLEGARKDVTVILAGSGTDEPALRRLARRDGPGGVVFAGFVQPRDLANYYCAADVYVHCAEREAYGVAVSEAVYAGLPAVVSDRCGCQGSSDVARPGVNAHVYPCADVAALTAALTRLLDCPERLAAMGRASKRIGRDIQRRAHGDALLQALDGLGLLPDE